MNAFISLLVAVLLAGGTSFAASTSVPGDFLYPVKINFNDNLKESLAFSAESKADANADIAASRLEEAEKLVVEGELNAEANAKITQNFKDHSARVSALIEKLMSSDSAAAAKVASDFEASLKAHKNILTQLSAKADATEKTELAKLETEVKAIAKTTENLRVRMESALKTETSANVKAAAEGRIGAAKNKIAEVRSYISNVKARLGADAAADAEARLAIAESTLAQANAQVASQAFADAFLSASLAHRVAQDAQLLATNRIDLNTNLNIGGGSDTGLNVRLPDVMEKINVDGAVNGAVDGMIKTDFGAGSTSNLNIKTDTDSNLENDMIDTRLDTTLDAETKMEIK